VALERTFLATPVPSAGGRVIVSPFQFAVDGSDHLRIDAWNSLTGVSLQVSYRFAELGGTIVAHRRDLALTADRVRNTLVVPLQPGYLVNLTALVTGAAPRIGQTFVSIKLQRGLGAAAIILGLLVQGYVTAVQGLGWPGSPIEDSARAGGVFRALTGTDPAASNDCVETVPTGAQWDLAAFSAVLSTDATAVNRRPSLKMAIGGIVVFTSPAPGFLGANQTSTFIWAAGLAHDTLIAQSNITAGLPTFGALPGGSIISTETSSMQAGDNWGAPQFLVRETLEVDA